MQKFLSFLNDNHWYIVSAFVIFGLFFWTYGCESHCKSLLSPGNFVNRGELEAEIEYLAKLADSRIQDLNKKDEIKQQLLDAVNVISNTGSINPAGLLNLAATIAAISFGLNRNQKLKNVLKSSTETS